MISPTPSFFPQGIIDATLFDMPSIELTAMVFPEGGGRWTARCLDYDFFGESDSEDGAIENLVLAMASEVQFAVKDGRQPFEGVPQPPAGFLKQSGLG